MFVPDLDGLGVEVAKTPFDINDRVTVLQELQQFREDNSSKSATSTGIKDVPGYTERELLFYPRCQVRKKIALFLLTMPSYNMLLILHSRPRGTSSSSRIPLTTGEEVPLHVIYTNTVAPPSLGRVDDDFALAPLTTNNLETFDQVTMTTDVTDGAVYSVPP
ncbi:hypothetical protein NDU88_005077 [Pleurodeles waltl]|uniref:Uncharacterized protein n=1 Tax=Pleurodeles waltl TaxID=8319 RepID=A0AAV7WWK8_PLEWA|nr:hypothetical protein NDU88_005077 [Pleurodeles waltl]